MGKAVRKKKPTTSKVDKKQFKRVAKDAKKAGLLVDRKAYDRYFREKFSQEMETAE